MIATTENTIASERYNAVEILTQIAPLISVGRRSTNIRSRRRK